MTDLLLCPACGAHVEPELSYVGRPYMQDRELTGFECENFACDARWTSDGKLERPSKFDEVGAG